MSRTIIENGIVFTGTEVLAPAVLVIDDDRITQVLSGPSDPAAGRGLPEALGDPGTQANREAQRDPATRMIDAAGRLVTPGLVNAHTHIYSALARGIALKDPPPTDFLEILQRLWWRLDRALTLEQIGLSTRLHGIECLKHGVTTIFDHHASQKVVSGSLETISATIGDLGLRASLCFEVSDRDGMSAASAGIEENLSFIKETEATGGAMRRATFGLHASFTLSDETLKTAVDGNAGRVGFHIHVAEGTVDQEATRARHGKGILERLRGFGILGERTICVHGIHLDDREIEILAETRCWHAHCPESNMNNAVGAPRLERFARRGVRTVLGTDGFTANILREALVGHLLQSHEAEDPRAGYAVMPSLPFGANMDLARQTFDPGLGQLRPGAPADVVVWGYRPPSPLSAENLWGHVMFGLVDARAEDVWIAGRPVLRNGRVTGCDEDGVADRCLAAAADLWRRF